MNQVSLVHRENLGCQGYQEQRATEERQALLGRASEVKLDFQDQRVIQVTEVTQDLQVHGGHLDRRVIKVLQR